MTLCVGLTLGYRDPDKWLLCQVLRGSLVSTLCVCVSCLVLCAVSGGSLGGGLQSQPLGGFCLRGTSAGGAGGGSRGG